jgi:hypothetical protein
MVNWFKMIHLEPILHCVELNFSSVEWKFHCVELNSYGIPIRIQWEFDWASLNRGGDPHLGVPPPGGGTLKSDIPNIYIISPEWRFCKFPGSSETSRQGRAFFCNFSIFSKNAKKPLFWKTGKIWRWSLGDPPGEEFSGSQYPLFYRPIDDFGGVRNRKTPPQAGPRCTIVPHRPIFTKSSLLDPFLGGVPPPFLIDLEWISTL